MFPYGGWMVAPTDTLSVIANNFHLIPKVILPDAKYRVDNKQTQFCIRNIHIQPSYIGELDILPDTQFFVGNLRLTCKGEYNPIFGRGTAGDGEGVIVSSLSRGSCLRPAKRGHLYDIISGRYVEFKNPMSECLECVCYQGGCVGVLCRDRDTHVYLYRQGNQPWCVKQKVDCDIINLLRIQFVGDAVFYKCLYNDKQIFVSRIPGECVFDGFMVFPVHIHKNQWIQYDTKGIALIVGWFYVDLEQLLKGVSDSKRMGIYNVCMVSITINNIYSYVEPDIMRRIQNKDPDRSTCFMVTHETNTGYFGCCHVETMYDKKLWPLLRAAFDRVLYPVFADIVVKYLLRQLPW